jgi:molybdate transport system regulatory protein
MATEKGGGWNGRRDVERGDSEDRPGTEGRPRIEARSKVYLTDEQGKPFLGIGVLWLLRNIQQYGSIRKAAGAMHLSYAKAHRMVDEAERGLGFELLERRRGGDSREGASLTPRGSRFVEEYDRFQERIKEETRRAFADFQPFIRDLAADSDGGSEGDSGGSNTNPSL